MLGPPRDTRLSEDAVAAGMAAVACATVSDLQLLGPTSSGGLAAQREFRSGEVMADHRRQLLAAGDTATRLAMPVVTSASDILHAHRTGCPGLLLCCEGADFAEDDLALSRRPTRPVSVRSCSCTIGRTRLATCKPSRPYAKA